MIFRGSVMRFRVGLRPNGRPGRVARRATVLSALLAASPAHAADLIQTYRDAAANDAQYASARNTLTAGRERLPQGLSLLLPQASAALGGARVNAEITQPQPFGGYSATYNQRTYTLSLSQPLFRWSNWQQYLQGKASVLLSEAQFAQAQQDLIVRTVQAYFDVLYAEDSINYIVAQKAAVTEQLASAKRNFDVGTTPITDTNEAQAKFDLDIAQAALQQIIGKAPGNLAPLVRDVELTQPEPRTIDPWVASAETQNYAVAQNVANLEIARRQVEVNRSGHYPTVDLVASRTYANGGSTITGVNTQTNSSIGVQVSVPLYSGGFTSSKVREGIALAEKAENIDVLNAQQQLYSTQRDLARARYDTLLNGLRLKSAAGTLVEADLAGINALLQH